MAYQDPKVTDPAPIEKLGAFYLGRSYDTDAQAPTDAPILYDAKDLTTHAVCVGMTGSGKTGLCLSLLEEAAIDGIPAIAIDPKGDIGNLLLGFPNLEPADFEPWVDPGAATRKGETVAEHAASTAKLWRKGLADWGQDGRRIERLKNAVDIAIYTPGSNAGLPISLLASFSAPAAALRDDPDGFRERISAAASGLLALLGIDADPVRSREHILLSTILDHHWRAGRNLDVAQLIQEIQQPPFDTVGVMALESVYPAGDRFELSMMLNNLLASPGFAAWMDGAPLDIAKLLWTDTGKPRIAVLSIAHLSDAERMFFVTILLNEIVAWVRAQSGTTSLRALLYMDEVFGYFPPSKNPPSKTPMLTLLKQARAYGLGVVLATQNPVDLDYKGLSNTGTWFIGRLQTERDKLRVLDGLEGAAASSGSGFDRAAMDRVMSGLSSRVFLMNNVHDDEPVLMHTRWALSYLRGPVTRDEIKRLMSGRVAAETAGPSAVAAAGTGAIAALAAKEMAPRSAADKAPARPMVPPNITEHFLPAIVGGSSGANLVYRPMVLGSAELHYADARRDLDLWRQVTCLSPLGQKPTAAKVWRDGVLLFDQDLDLDTEPEPDARFAALPPAAMQAKPYTSWKTALKAHVYRQCGLSLQTCKALKLTSRPDESAAAFQVRVNEAVRQQRDLAVEKLRKKYTPKLARLEQKIRAAEHRLEREQSQYKSQKLNTAISVGATVLGALFGRKMASIGTVGRASTAVRGAGRAARERGDVQRAAEQIDVASEQLSALSAEFEAETDTVRDAMAPELLEFSETLLRPRKTELNVGAVALVWAPYWVDGSGLSSAAFEAG